jgi:hypothetical protein
MSSLVVTNNLTRWESSQNFVANICRPSTQILHQLYFGSGALPEVTVQLFFFTVPIFEDVLTLINWHDAGENTLQRGVHFKKNFLCNLVLGPLHMH